MKFFQSDFFNLILFFKLGLKYGPGIPCIQNCHGNLPLVQLHNAMKWFPPWTFGEKMYFLSSYFWESSQENTCDGKICWRIPVNSLRHDK